MVNKDSIFFSGKIKKKHMARRARRSKADIQAQRSSKRPRSTTHQNRWKKLSEAQKAKILAVLAEGRKKRTMKYKKSAEKTEEDGEK